MLKIAIIGTAPLSVDLAPYQDKDWTIWACSPGNMGGRLPRVDAWFELHAIGEMTAPEHRASTIPYYAWLRSQQFPVWMQEHNDYIPQARVYPLPLMIEKFGRNWFTSSIAYMMALAIHQGAREIGLFGVDMAATSELYSGQKAGLVRFTEFAKERGIIVTTPQESCLGRDIPLYGYNEASHMGRRVSAMKHRLTADRARLDDQIRRSELERAYFDGAIEQLRYFEATWVDGSEADLQTEPVAAAPAPRLEPTFVDFKASGGGVLMPLNGDKINGTGGHAAQEGQ